MLCKGTQRSTYSSIPQEYFVLMGGREQMSILTVPLDLRATTWRSLSWENTISHYKEHTHSQMHTDLIGTHLVTRAERADASATYPLLAFEMHGGPKPTAMSRYLY